MHMNNIARKYTLSEIYRCHGTMINPPPDGSAAFSSAAALAGSASTSAAQVPDTLPLVANDLPDSPRGPSSIPRRALAASRSSGDRGPSICDVSSANACLKAFDQLLRVQARRRVLVNDAARRGLERAATLAVAIRHIRVDQGSQRIGSVPHDNRLEQEEKPRLPLGELAHRRQQQGHVALAAVAGRRPADAGGRLRDTRSRRGTESPRGASCRSTPRKSSRRAPGTVALPGGCGRWDSACRPSHRLVQVPRTVNQRLR